MTSSYPPAAHHHHGVAGVAGETGSDHPGPAEQLPAFDAQWWERHYREAADHPAAGPGAQLVAELSGMGPGTVLDAGCGTGADTLWLARQGWEVTAVDVSPTAVQQARTLVAEQQPDLASRVGWHVADLSRWQPPQRYDLVVSLYVHPDLPFGDFVGRLAAAVAPGGTLLVVGHSAADRHSADHAPQPAAIDADAVVGVLDPDSWVVTVAEARTRRVTQGSTETETVDVVVRAHRATD